MLSLMNFQFIQGQKVIMHSHAIILHNLGSYILYFLNPLHICFWAKDLNQWAVKFNKIPAILDMFKTKFGKLFFYCNVFWDEVVKWQPHGIISELYQSLFFQHLHFNVSWVEMNINLMNFFAYFHIRLFISIFCTLTLFIILRA